MKTGNFNLELDSDERGGFVINGLKKKGVPLLDFENAPNFQVRWIRIKTGDSKPEAHADPITQALVILIKGHHEVLVGDEKVVLKNEGDFIYLAPKEKHSWETREDTLLVVVRWV